MKLFLILVLSLYLGGIVQAQNRTQINPPKEAVLERFLHYVKIDTQSQEDQETVPSTRKQLELATLLARELKELRAVNVRVS
ncbi:MAG TPA: hypothetical protein VMM84_04050 [Pyrinomonadaceae bacterium]|nr:hypothetical protein [Pyrinomonadaceae bacterium]